MTTRTLCCCLLFCATAYPQQTLHNGISLPAVWPPRNVPLTNEPPPDPPYLLHPPEIIPIDVGRQLFVDDFLIETTDLRREFHRPQWYTANPVLKGDKPWEAGQAMTFSDGVFYDPQDRVFKIWYRGVGATLYATSIDGVHWDKPLLDVKPGTNVVNPGSHDSSTVWLDLDERDPQKRYKMGWSLGHNRPFVLFVSADGIHWGKPVAQSIVSSDRITFFKNPFRNLWVFSLRDHDWVPSSGKSLDYIGRFRLYWESPEFETGVNWKPGEATRNNPRVAAPVWAMADRLDPRRLDLNVQPELYNLDAVAYESILLGLFTIWPGQFEDSEKANYLTVGYSRDGFHWSRPDRRAFLGPTGKHGDWNFANVQSAGGVCLVVGDRLFFYVSGRAGVPGRRASGDMSTGIATLRRDGFVSMNAGETTRTLTTRQVRFSGGHLFVNVDSNAGELRVEVLDANNRVINKLSAADSITLRTNNTLTEVHWRGVKDLSSLSGKPVRFRFQLRNGALYSFWVSKDERGSSNGYVGAGGPGLTATRDTVGTDSYRFCCRPTTW